MANKGSQGFIPYQFTKQTAKAAGSKAGKASGKVRARQAIQKKLFRYQELYMLMLSAESEYKKAAEAAEIAKQEYLTSCKKYVAKYGEDPC